MQKCEVNGDDALPSFTWLKENTYLEGKDLEWNFCKFIVNRYGKVLMYYEPRWHPLEMVPHIERCMRYNKLN